jgi:hypothetical protein
MVNQLFTHSPAMLTPPPNRRQSVSEETRFWTLKLLQDNPGVTQRTLPTCTFVTNLMTKADNKKLKSTSFSFSFLKQPHHDPACP